MHRGQTAPVSALRGEKRSRALGLLRRVTFLAFAFAVVAADVQAIVSEAREILATGDEIEGFGIVGVEDFVVVGIASDDRVVFRARTSTGATGVFSTSAKGVQTLWLASDLNDHPVQLGRIRTNANRVVFAQGFAPTDIFFNEIIGFYQLSAGAAVPVVERGDVTPEGDEICSLVDFVVSDTGAVAFSAYAAPPEVECDLDDWSENLYVFEAGSIRRVLRTGDTQPPTLNLIGLSDDGALQVGFSDGSAILRVGEGRLERIVSRDDPSPSGTPFGFLRAGASNSLGEVAFYAHHGTALYRTFNGSFVLVAENGDRIEGGYELDGFSESSTAINDAGVVVVEAQLRGQKGPPLQAAVLFPPAGLPRLLTRFGTPGGINDSGMVAVLETDVELGRDGVSFVARGTREPLKRLVAFGDAAPDGGVFASSGLGESTLASDGRVAAIVRTGSFSSATLVCGDADGFVAVAGPINPARDGGTIALPGLFALAETGLLFLGAESGEPMSLYLASDAGLERLVGPGDTTTDGTTIGALVSFPDSSEDPRFASNGRGSVLVRALTNQGVHFVRRQPGGGLETILFDLGPDLPIQRNISAGILDDDTVIVAVDVGDGEYAILTSDGTSPRLLATGSDPLLPGGPFGFMTLLSVVGERAVILAETADNSAQRTLSYTEAAGFVPFFADQVDRNLKVATAGGRALVEQIRDGVLTQFLFSPDGSGSLLTEYRGMGEPRAVGINDRDNVLFLIDGTQLGTRPHLSLAGPTPSARCPRLAPATETPSATQTPTPMETPTSTQTLAPTGTAQSTETAAPTQTAEPTETVPSTQTATHTATAVSASPTAADSLEFNDGCEVVPPRRATGWALLPPVFLVLVRGLARFRNRKVCRATRPRLFKRRC